MMISLDGGQTFHEATEGVQVIYDDVDIPGIAEPGEVHINLTSRRSCTDIWAGEDDHIASKAETVDELVERLTPNPIPEINRDHEFDEVGFQAAVARHWNYHSTCHHRLWSTERTENEVMEFRVAPVFQEVLGGREDGQKVWTAFDMSLSNLFAEPNLEVTEFGCQSYCTECTPTPLFGVRGKYQGHPFVMNLHLQPIPDSKPVEIIDRFNNEVRAIKGRQP